MRTQYLGRRGVIALGALLTASALAGCGDASNAEDPPSSSDAAATTVNGSVAAARQMLAGAAAVSPGQYQTALLAKPSLSYADYESAMQAMAHCVEERAPGTKVTLMPSQYDPRMFDASYVYGGVDVKMSVSDGAATNAEEPAPRHEDTSASSATESPVAPTEPPSMVERDRVIGNCQLEYSAFVEDAWRGQQVLTASEEKVQKPQFLKCLTDAGVKLPTDTSDSNLGKWLATPEWFAGLSDAQSKQAEKCTSDFVDLTNTFAK